MAVKKNVLDISKSAFYASRSIGSSSIGQIKNAVLKDMARLLQENSPQIIEANMKDMDTARKKSMSENTLKRLLFDKEKIESRINSINKIISLPDPVGVMTKTAKTENGLTAGRLSVPLGVILMIYEARPHVTVNGGALCFKAGNAVILRGGSEAAFCNSLLGKLWQKSLQENGMPAETIQVFTGSHEEIDELLKMKQYIDLVIPRGSRELIEKVSARSSIPVLKHSAGICHVYIDCSANWQKALKITLDSKCLMPSVCNAAETLLLSEKLITKTPVMLKKLKEAGVRLKGCAKTIKAAKEIKIEPASEEDWKTEYLDLTISVKIIKDINEAIEHINLYGSGHTDTIVTENYSNAKQFTEQIDSSVVLVNASTMFCDGETLGMGAEVGISTDKIHARGPVGVEDLTTYKHVILGNGQVMGK